MLSAVAENPRGSSQLLCVYLDIFQVLQHSETIDMTVNILTQGFWPAYPVVEVHLPSEVSQDFLFKHLIILIFFHLNHLY